MSTLDKYDAIIPYVPNRFTLPTIVGACTYPVLYPVMFVGQSGIDYYAEVHQTSWNAYCHTVGMPFTILGMLMWIPVCVTNNPKIAQEIQQFLYISYGSYYFCISPQISAMYFAMYYYPYIKAHEYFNTYNNKKDRFTTFILGFMIAFFALLFQEVVGHWYGGDDLSRFEAIPNAILHAKYFSISHMIGN